MSVLGSVSIGTIIGQILPIALGGRISALHASKCNVLEDIVEQLTDYEYQFGYNEHQEIVDWLTSDCVWPYYGYTGQDAYSRERAVVIFEDIRGSIEFKLRFIE